MNAEVLNSWKEIAAYMGRGVRTVQRWEQELGLPVRRPRGKERSAVIALKPDLDRWLQRVPQGNLTERASDSHRHEALHVSTDLLMKRMQEIVERSAHMQEVVKSTLALTSKLRDQQTARMREYESASSAQRLLMRKTLNLSAALPTRRGRRTLPLERSPRLATE
ncbi:MAG TPA: hypothetical protein VFY05_14135 [Candidatus Angelobacter sp.]|nr:hypothetical protein [Candidatus Angelobacter sp.]